jgi:hypothetical protein
LYEEAALKVGPVARVSPSAALVVKDEKALTSFCRRSMSSLELLPYSS